MPDGRARVLIVDDEESSRDTVRAQLTADRYALETACSGMEVIDRLKGAPVDLIICDVLMPRMDGFEVCRQVKAHPVWRFTPLILATALEGEDDLVRGLEAGADDFLSKPVPRVVLRARVRALLRIRAHYNQLLRTPADLDELLRTRRERIIESAALSPRERQVLELLLLGRTHEEIGKVLDISPRTSKHHQQSLLAKLGADSRHDLSRLFL